MFRKELMPILLNSSKKLQRKEYFQTHSMRPPSPWYQNQTKTTHKKENYRLISLMNIDAKILNKILANRIQQYSLHIMIKLGLFQGCKDSSIYAKQSMWYTILTIEDKNHMIISIDAEKAFDKIQHPFMIKTLQKMGIEWTYLNIVKAIYNKPTANIILNGEKLKAFSLRSWTRRVCPLLVTITQHSFGSPSYGKHRRKTNKRNPHWKEEVKHCFQMTWYYT